MFKHVIGTLLVFSLSLFLCVYRIGDFSFGRGDQTTHSVVIQEMVHSGSWWSPQLEGNFYSNKPPFKMWLVALTVKLLGESNFSYRIIDGLTGIVLAITLYWFSAILFSSSLVGIFTALSLLSANMLYFGHGVRNATQDSVMLLLFTLGMILGWRCIEKALETNRQRLSIYALALGITIGLAVLTKNVVGYLSFAILVFYLFCTKQFLQVFRNAWKEIALAIGTSLIIPALYFVPHCVRSAGACHNFFISEVYKRAAVGYHNVKNTWYYFEWLGEHRIAVPPELLLVGLIYFFIRYYRTRERRILFFLVWAIAPVIVFTIAKSKIFWYILPALPAMAVIAGVTIADAIFYCLRAFRTYVLTEKVAPLRVATISFFIVASIGSLSYSILQISKSVLEPSTRTFSDRLTNALLKEHQQGKPKETILHYDTPRLSRDEDLYWQMLNQTVLTEKSSEETLKKEVARHRYLLSDLSHFETLVKMRPVLGYSFLPARYQRRRWLLVLNYADDQTLDLFTPATRRIDFGNPDLDALYGEQSRGPMHGRTIMISKGGKTGVVISCDHACSLFGTDVDLELASLLPSERGALNVSVFINEIKVATIEFPPKNFHRRSFFVPPHVWQSHRNNVTFVYEPINGPIMENEQAVLLDEMQISLHQRDTLETPSH